MKSPVHSSFDVSGWFMRAIRDSALDSGDGGVTDELPVKKNRIFRKTGVEDIQSIVDFAGF